MRSLFLKIFLWFWGTVALVGLALVIASSLQPERVISRWRSVTSDALALYASSTADYLEDEGPRAATGLLDRLHRESGIRAMLLKEDGTPVLGKVTDEERDLAVKAVSSGNKELIVKATEAIGAVAATTRSGKRYVLVAELPRGPGGPLRDSSQTQMVRWLIAVAVSGLICYLLTRYLTSPILRLQSAARNIAAGDLAARADPKSATRRDELGELVRDFNHMAGRIETLVRTQQELLRDISHELRSPLARLTVALGLARQRATAEIAPQLDRIERESERLNEMIGRLLTLARIQAATEPPEGSSVSLRPLIEEIAADARYEASARNSDVAVDAPADCIVIGAPQLLYSAVENVVRNAVRYTGPGTKVEISLRCDGSNGVIRVRDHGPGVPESELPNIFRPFYRIGSARERESGGTGIGLAITYGAIRLHGGKALVRNAEDGGLEVTLSLPASAPIAPPVPEGEPVRTA
jgi:two-component system sensor histidine kinase CpxA